MADRRLGKAARSPLGGDNAHGPSAARPPENTWQDSQARHCRQVPRGPRCLTPWVFRSLLPMSAEKTHGSSPLACRTRLPPARELLCGARHHTCLLGRRRRDSPPCRLSASYWLGPPLGSRATPPGPLRAGKCCSRPASRQRRSQFAPVLLTQRLRLFARKSAAVHLT